MFFYLCFMYYTPYSLFLATRFFGWFLSRSNTAGYKHPCVRFSDADFLTYTNSVSYDFCLHLVQLSNLNFIVFCLAEVLTVSSHQWYLHSKASGSRKSWNYMVRMFVLSMQPTKRQYMTCRCFSCVCSPMWDMSMLLLFYCVMSVSSQLRLDYVKLHSGMSSGSQQSLYQTFMRARFQHWKRYFQVCLMLLLCLHSCCYMSNELLNVLNKAGIVHLSRFTTMYKIYIYIKNEKTTACIIPYICCI